MFIEGTYKETFGLLFEKLRLLRAGDPEHQRIRPLLLALGGVMRGVYGGGHVTAFETFDLADAFDTVVGVSAGSPNVAYFLARQARLGTSIYYGTCTHLRFMPPIPLWVGADYLARDFRTGPKALDQERIYACRTDIYAAATCARTGKGALLNAKETKPDVVQALRQSFAVPFLTGPAVDSHLDGVGGFPFPAREIMERFQPTDLIVLANKKYVERQSNAEGIAFGLACTAYPRAVREAFASSGARYFDELTWLRTEKPCRVAILWCDDGVGKFERNPKRLWAAARRAELHLSGLLAEASDLVPI